MDLHCFDANGLLVDLEAWRLALGSFSIALSLLENPEPRYVVEYFPLLATAGSLLLAVVKLWRSK
jgi:hypothetical protein